MRHKPNRDIFSLSINLTELRGKSEAGLKQNTSAKYPWATFALDSQASLALCYTLSNFHRNERFPASNALVQMYVVLDIYQLVLLKFVLQSVAGKY